MLIRRAVVRDRLAATRVTIEERERWHRAAAAAGMPFAEFLREAARKYVRLLEREAREAGARDTAP
jgi:hypothetical protein